MIRCDHFLVVKCSNDVLKTKCLDRKNRMHFEQVIRSYMIATNIRKQKLMYELFQLRTRMTKFQTSTPGTLEASLNWNCIGCHISIIVPPKCLFGHGTKISWSSVSSCPIQMFFALCLPSVTCLWSAKHRWFRALLSLPKDATFSLRFCSSSRLTKSRSCKSIGPWTAQFQWSARSIQLEINLQLLNFHYKTVKTLGLPQIGVSWNRGTPSHPL